MECADAKGKATNFLRQFRDLKTREFKQITAQQFMEVWNHYDEDGESLTYVHITLQVQGLK